jgi:hypothetical protein
MTGAEGLKEVIYKVEEIEHRLDDRVRELEKEQEMQRHLPGDLSAVVPLEPPQTGSVAPELGS